MSVAAPGLCSVVVVSADSGPLVRECVGRVLASSVPVEVVLVDNASTDGEPEAALAAHAGDARLRILHQARNLGFGAACNRGAALARGDALLFLNPDCLIEADTIERLHAVAAGHAQAGLVGVRVEDALGRPERAVRRREPTLRRALMTMSGLARFEARCPALAGVAVPAASMTDGIEVVEAVSGACMYLPRAAFAEVGGFDEAYFLHAEDLDLCRRLRDAGHQVLFAGAIRVRHEQGSSSRHRAGFVARHKRRSLWRYFNRFDPAARNPLLRVVVRVGLALHHLAGILWRALRRVR
ncbi:MAG TPA: glycosyltransferase family 2 protein [Dokdonella sp.]|uniref:glycosyltransferase family 2 protein n=1 Tax=Dokdonella sp. TaxID=2291710 RepID=UPI0025BF315B|nr:glycosyltransferase family 2 protein [Dokdonella sp.]MBX3690796.1 glycosyltransferase family 2 protein [Dokdonella sp.]MCW5566618.1 glycosyltransferase family 2 protein [Dokdonella sp.]HNR91671.1 glycosyltransferase family 2 protein [Dokdonella sp.]